MPSMMRCVFLFNEHVCVVDRIFLFVCVCLCVFVSVCEPILCLKASSVTGVYALGSWANNSLY